MWRPATCRRWRIGQPILSNGSKPAPSTARNPCPGCARCLCRAAFTEITSTAWFWPKPARAAEKDIAIETMAGEAVDVVPTADGARVVLSNGQSLEVNKVVLATGNSAPSSLSVKGFDAAHPRYFQNPWADWESKLVDRTENVILIGTGLTAVDAFLSLKDLNWRGKIFAISRNGLLPLSHFKGMEYADWLDPKAGKITLTQAFKAFRRNFRDARSHGVNPAILVDKLRPMTQQASGRAFR